MGALAVRGLGRTPAAAAEAMLAFVGKDRCVFVEHSCLCMCLVPRHIQVHTICACMCLGTIRAEALMLESMDPHGLLR